MTVCELGFDIVLRLVGYGLVVLALALTYRPRDSFLNFLSHWRFTILGAPSFSCPTKVLWTCGWAVIVTLCFISLNEVMVSYCISHIFK